MGIESFFTSDNIVTILQWAVMILITGFIAQFGKKFAEFLIDRAKDKKLKKMSHRGTSALSQQEARRTAAQTDDHTSALQQKDTTHTDHGGRETASKAKSSTALHEKDDGADKDLKKIEKEKLKQQKKKEKAEQKRLKKSKQT